MISPGQVSCSTVPRRTASKCASTATGTGPACRKNLTAARAAVGPGWFRLDHRARRADDAEAAKVPSVEFGCPKPIVISREQLRPGIARLTTLGLPCPLIQQGR